MCDQMAGCKDTGDVLLLKLSGKEHITHFITFCNHTNGLYTLLSDNLCLSQSCTHIHYGEGGIVKAWIRNHRVEVKPRSNKAMSPGEHKTN